MTQAPLLEIDPRRSYDQIQIEAQLVTCVRCAKSVYATHPSEPYTCQACR